MLKILFIRCDRIGDAVLTTPVIRALKEQVEGLELHVLASPKNRFVFQENPYIDKIHVIKNDHWLQDYHVGIRRKIRANFIDPLLAPFFHPQWRPLFSSLRREKFDVIVDGYSALNTALIARFIGSKVIGGGRSYLKAFYYYNYRIPWYSPPGHLVEKYQDAINEALGIHLSCYGLEEEVFQREWDSLPQGLPDTFVLFLIGTAEYREPSEGELISLLREINSWLHSKGFSLVVALNPERVSLKGDLERLEFPVVVVSLPTLARVAERSSLVICYDSGGAHYLSSFKRALFLFGPTSHEVWRPWDGGEYKHIKKFKNGVRFEKSLGPKGHGILCAATTCSPCKEGICEHTECLSRLRGDIICEGVESLLE